jgi:DNA-directed RNA polymerase subunit L
MKRFYKIVLSFMLLLLLGLTAAYYTINHSLESNSQSEVVTTDQVTIFAVFKDLVD